ncbi:MAG: hypothetical protein GVY14_14345 [Spirochaetes bacterium]|jgi:hypothetical protein|nr:hypothetical protein [Spirochaetota bacterium]
MLQSTNAVTALVVTLTFLFGATGWVFAAVHRRLLSSRWAAPVLVGIGILAAAMFALLIA